MLARLAFSLSILALPAQAQYVLSDGTEVAPLEMFQECDVCPEMIVLPLGEFLMGGPPGESRLNIHLGANPMRWATPEDPYIAYHEGPVHPVKIDMPIAIGRNEVTHEQWMACVNDGGCGGHVPRDCILQRDAACVDVRGNYPVVDVSYSDGVAYTKWLNDKIGADVYRLPKEAEWEYAARAGTQTPFAQGEEVTTDQVNFHGKPTEEMLGVKRPELARRGHPVRVDDLDAANAWGLRHMSGNVVERTMSCWTSTHIGSATVSDYLRHAMLPACTDRVGRGGAYWTAMDFSRVASRGRVDEDARLMAAGFRVLRDF
ncbi:formylglycine-generating enzyme family protein [Ruegeria lacuscaerulensis]|uniref:formylglycine-generating enzyme family protein n=1 Tax=Ruegeria lacuscaerulensis TaxID=55218 RepID=UPI001480A3C2|nr:formylglycine-generating enzyme family protein [Ruegeria lacuscaerulensis]